MASLQARMSSPRKCTRTPLSVALLIAAALACFKTSHAQLSEHDYETLTNTLAQIMARVQAIENQTKDFKESILEEIWTLKDVVVCNKTDSGGDVVVCNKTDSGGKKASKQVAIGLVPRRRPDNSESILIVRNSQRESDISHWKMSLSDKVRYYEGQDYDVRSRIVDCSEEVLAGEGEVCNFQDTAFGPYCNSREYWGYERKSPCIIIEMNKIINWTPDVYTTIEELPTDMPEDLKNHINQITNYNEGRVPKMLWLNCKGQTSDDDEYVGELEYTPWRGFPWFYFPYKGNDDNKGRDEYLAPMVAVRFVAPAKNVLINIECKVYSKNISHWGGDNGSVIGVMKFELMID